MHLQHDPSPKQLPTQDSHGRYGDDCSQESRHHGYDYGRRDQQQEDKWLPKDKERSDKKLDGYGGGDHGSRDDWHDRKDKRDDKPQDRYDRPQRPDSRDSRSTRDSRHSRDSEPRDYMSQWASEPAYESYEDKKKEQQHALRDDRRTVPGPITKDRIEADDMRNEKRSLTQLKRGQNLDKRDGVKRDDKVHEVDELKKANSALISDMGGNDWAECLPPIEDSNDAKFSDDKSNKTSSSTDLHKNDKHFGGELKKSDSLEHKDGGRMRGGRGSQNKSGSAGGWGNSSEYHRSSGGAWNKRAGRGGGRSGGRPSSQVSGDFHGTDSEGSIEDHHSDKGKKQEKDEKNRESKEISKHQEKTHDGQRKSEGGKYDKHYVPRGEPSRIGRGGASFGSRNSRMGGLSKKIDGYGPPPKSPFGHHDDRDKKASSDEASVDPLATEDKTKLNQQALSAGMGIAPGGSKKDHDEKNRSRKDNRRGKSRSKNDGLKKDDDVYDTNSELSDEKDGKLSSKKSGGSSNKSQSTSRGSSSNPSRSDSRRNPPPRMGGSDKRYADGQNSVPRQNSNSSLKSKKEDKNEQNVLCNAIADISLKNREADGEDKDERSSINGDSEGFQEVKSKKTVKDKQKADEKSGNKGAKNDKDKDNNIGSNSVGGRNDRCVERKKTQQLTPQQIQNIPSLMATPVNPPQSLPKNNFERPRQQKLAPRFAKQKLQKAQMQQQQHSVRNCLLINCLKTINFFSLITASPSRCK